MFSWITGPRITNVIEDLQPENNYESTFLEPPETPAHQFAVNAFKHAIFGTPAPEDATKTAKKHEKKAKIDAANAKVVELPAPDQDLPSTSPSKQPGGVLRTPGTASKGRKTVSFGSHVVDNEGKRGNIGKSGIPSDCPGKFPSPWTPGIELKLDPGSDKRPRTKLTEALLDARTTTQPKSGQKPKARDDSDITIDLGAPRSESGRYWKEQYENYAEKSEKEMKKIIAKQQLAKKYAMKKDGEVTELGTKLEQERKRFRQRERELEQQNKDLQEELRQANVEKSSASIEIAALHARIATLEHSVTMTSSEVLQSKPSFQIYEDKSKDEIQTNTEQDKNVELSFTPSISVASSGKENNSPKSRRHRHPTLPDTIARPSAPSRLGVAEGEASIILGRSPRAPAPTPGVSSDAQVPATSLPEHRSKSPIKVRKNELPKENTLLQSPAAVLPSSPLPMPSPGIDPWMELNNDSSIHQVDKMTMPNYAGEPFSRPEWDPPPKQHRNVKSSSHAKHAAPSKPYRKADVRTVTETKAQATSVRSNTTERRTRDQEVQSKATAAQKDRCQEPSPLPGIDTQQKTDVTSHQSPTDPKFDLSKLTAHHAEGSSQVKKDRAEIVPGDRKAEAKKRLEERRRLRKNAPA